MSSKRSAEDILAVIESSDIDDAAERALAMTPEERRKELEAAGYTEEELAAKAAFWHERMGQPVQLVAEARDASHPATSRRTATVVLLVAAVAVGAILLALLLFPRLMTPEAPVAVPSSTAPVASSVGAPDAAPSEPPPQPTHVVPVPTRLK